MDANWAWALYKAVGHVGSRLYGSLHTEMPPAAALAAAAARLAAIDDEPYPGTPPKGGRKAGLSNPGNL